MGMKGYLATITSEKEERIIDNVSDKSGWGGGIRKASYGNDAEYITVEGGDNNGYIHFDGDDVDRNNEVNFTKFVWACGPEKGRSFGAKDGSQGYQHWRDYGDIHEPNNDATGVEYSGNVNGTYYNIPNVPAGNYTAKVLTMQKTR